MKNFFRMIPILFSIFYCSKLLQIEKLQIEDVGSFEIAGEMPSSEDATKFSVDITEHGTPEVLHLDTAIKGTLKVESGEVVNFEECYVYIIKGINIVSLNIARVLKVDKNGNFEARNLEYGQYTVFAGHFPGGLISNTPDFYGYFGSLKPEIFEISEQNKVKNDVVLIIKKNRFIGGKGEISGKILFEQGSNFEAKNLIMFISDRPELTKANFFFQKITTDSGEFKFTDLKFGNYYLKAYHYPLGDVTKQYTGYGYYSDGMFPIPVEITETSFIKKDVNFYVYKIPGGNKIIKGKIINQSSELKVENEIVLFFKKPFIDQNSHPFDFTTPLADGTFVQINMPEGEYYIYVFHFENGEYGKGKESGFGYYRNGPLPKKVIVKSGESLPDITVYVSRVSSGNGLISGAVSNAGDSAVVCLYKKAFPSSYDLPVRVATTKDDGSFVFSNLPEGTYFVYAYDVSDFENFEYESFGFFGNEYSVPLKVEVTEEQSNITDVNFKLQKVLKTPFSINGSVFFASEENDFENVIVTLKKFPFVESPSLKTVRVSRDNGSFEIKNIKPGAYYIGAFYFKDGDFLKKSDGYGFFFGNSKFPVQVAVGSGKDTVENINIPIEIVSPGECEITGTVSSSDINPFNAENSVLLLYSSPPFQEKSFPVLWKTAENDGSFVFSSLPCNSTYYLLAFYYGTMNLSSVPDGFGFYSSGFILPSAIYLKEKAYVSLKIKNYRDDASQSSISGTVSWQSPDFDYKNVVVALFSKPFMFYDYKSLIDLAIPDENGGFLFQNLSTGNYYVYAFYFENFEESSLPVAMGAYNNKLLPSKINISSENQVVTGVKISLKSVEFGKGIISGHITNLNGTNKYQKEVVVLFTSKYEGDIEKGVLVTGVDPDTGDYIFKNVPEGNFYVYAFYFDSGNFNSDPSKFSYFYASTPNQPSMIKVTEQNYIFPNVDIIFNFSQIQNEF